MGLFGTFLVLWSINRDLSASTVNEKILRRVFLTGGSYRVARAAKKPKSLGNHQCGLRVDGTNHTQPFAALAQDAEK